MEIASKKIKFHFVKTQAKNDVWLEKSSYRIAPLHTHTTKAKPKLQAKSQSSCIVIPKDSQVRSQKVSELESERSNMSISEREQAQKNITDTEKKFDGVERNQDKSGKQNTKVRSEDEEESDGISFGDIDDEDSDDDIDSDEGFDNKQHCAVDRNDKEQVEESPTVTDHSSLDGSLKRDFESGHAENSDLENESEKATDKPNKGFTIPKKKNESTKKSAIVIPKKVIPKKLQSSISSRTSLISNAARQAMLEKKIEKKSTNHSKRSLSLNHSPSKDIRQADRNKIHRDDYNSPSLKRKAFSNLSPSQSQHSRSPASNRPRSTGSPGEKGSNRRPMLSPKRSLNDQYSIEQRRERELYRDSKDYTAKGQSFTYPDSNGSRDYSIRSSSPNRSFNDRYFYEERRGRELYRDSNEYNARGESYSYQNLRDSRDNSFQNFNDRRDVPHSPSSDHRRGIDNPISRNYESYSQQDQYETDRGRSRRYDRSYDEGSHARCRERSSDYYDAKYDQNNDGGFHNDRRTNTDSSYYQCESRRFDDHGRRHEEESSVYASRSQENNDSRGERGSNEWNIGRNSHFDRVHNDYEQALPPNFDDSQYYRDDDRHSSCRHRDSGGHREKRRRRTFDGSDEYSRRLESYNNTQGRSYPNEDVGRDRSSR